MAGGRSQIVEAGHLIHIAVSSRQFNPFQSFLFLASCSRSILFKWSTSVMDLVAAASLWIAPASFWRFVVRHA